MEEPPKSPQQADPMEGAPEKVRQLVSGQLDPMSFESVQQLVAQSHHEPRDEDKILEAANEVLGGYGVEGLRQEGAYVDRYHFDIIATYVNMGDTYVPTLLLDSETGQFMWTSWGDFLEGWEQEHAEEPEEEEVEESACRIVDRLLESDSDPNYAEAVRIQILQYVDQHHAWPADATPEDRAELVHDGFVDESEGTLYLTSLGELEIGYPETDDQGEVREDEEEPSHAFNLDGMPVEELEALMPKLRSDRGVPGAYRRYASQKILAMRARASGDIPTAQRHEHNCELLYQEIPEDWKW